MRYPEGQAMGYILSHFPYQNQAGGLSCVADPEVPEGFNEEMSN